MRRTAVTKLRDPMTMSLSAIDKELHAISKRYADLLDMEQKIQRQHMEDTDRCLALKAARTIYTSTVFAGAHP